MSTGSFSLPFQQQILLRAGESYLELALDLDVRAAQEPFQRVPFLLDTGSKFTTIPIAIANQLGLPVQTGRPVWIRGATALARIQAYLSPVWLSFPVLPAWQFRSECCFTPAQIGYALLALRDIIPHFDLSTARPIPQAPHGSLLFVLRDDHGGMPR
jgi:hypothetical protein